MNTTGQHHDPPLGIAASPAQISVAAARCWDAVVVGAGPAGSAAAWALARAGATVLIIDRDTFPRPKVCGCCLGPIGIGVLDDMGVLGSLDHRVLRTVELVTHARARACPLPRTITIARETMDPALLAAAIGAGAQPLLGLKARIEDGRVTVQLGSRPAGAPPVTIESATVVDARGLYAGSAAAVNGHRSRPKKARRAYVGIGGTLHPKSPVVPGDTLRMAIGRHGYLGVAPLADGRVSVAAAVSAEAIRTLGSRAAVLAPLLDIAGLDGMDREASALTGVPPLRIQRPAQDGRLFRVGDAARFVEPITGEGMGWALAAGRAVAGPVLERIAYEQDKRIGRATPPEAWPREHTRLLRRSFLRCAAVSALVHRPGALNAVLGAVQIIPGIGQRTLASAVGRTTRHGTRSRHPLPTPTRAARVHPAHAGSTQ